MNLGKLWELLSGKKTYIASTLAALWPVLAPLLGLTGSFDASDVPQIMLAIAIAALRSGIASSLPGLGPLLALLPQLIGLLQKLIQYGPQILTLLEQLKAEADKVPAPKPAPAPNFDVLGGAEPTLERPNPSARILPALLCCLLIPAACQAAPLKAVLIGPTTAEAGSDVFLDASQSEGDAKFFLYRVTPELNGRRQLVATDKQKPRLLTYPGTWTIELIVVSEDGEQSRAYHTVTIPGTGPCPTPEPGPHPQPTPQPTPMPIPPEPPKPGPVDPAPPRPAPPAGEFGIAPQLYTLAKAVNKPDDCRRLADQAQALAAKCAAGGVTSMQAVLDELAADLKPLGPEWAAVKNAAGSAIKSIWMAGMLPDVKAFGRLLTEIEGALRAAAG